MLQKEMQSPRIQGTPEKGKKVRRKSKFERAWEKLKKDPVLEIVDMAAVLQ
jgi:hypothetical protein